VTTTVLYLIRHAASAPTPDLDTADYPLSPEGRAQAEALVPGLSRLGLTRVVSSPWPRARDTVAPFAARVGLPIEEDADLRERRIANRWLPDFQAFVRASWEDLDLAEPGCESGREARARMTAALLRIAAASPGEVVAVATHGQVLAHALAWADEDAGFATWEALAFPDLRKLVLGPEGPRWERDWSLPG
jgi:2,3-bisphosphoglycerate-dependent phosphoglycerate mutase